MRKASALRGEDAIAYIESVVRKSARKRIADLTGEPLYKLAIAPNQAGRYHVLFIDASPTEWWQLAARKDILAELERLGLTCETLDSDAEFLWDECLSHQKRALARRRSFDAVVMMIPTWGVECSDVLHRFATRFGKLVVFVDQNPPRDLHLPPNCVYVSVSDVRGGRMAGAALASLGRLRKILIVTDEPKPARFLACQATVRLALPDCEFSITRHGGFDPGKSADVTEKMLMEALRTPRPVDGIFTTSESMGAGAIIAADSVAKRAGCRRPHIVTYDGLQDARDWIAQGKIAHAVVQETEAVAEVVGEQLVSRLHHLEPPERRAWVPPYLWGKRTRPLIGHTKIDMEAALIADAQLKATGRILLDTDNKELRTSLEAGLAQMGNCAITDRFQVP